MKIRLSIFCLLLTGCMTTSIPQFQNVTTSKNGNIPELNQRSSTDVGSTIYTEFDYQEIRAVRLSDDINSAITNIPKGTSLTAMTMDGKPVYQPYSTNFAGILLSDDNNDGKLDHIKNIASLYGGWKQIQSPASFKEADGIPTESGGFKLELVYQGITDNTIKVAYREFNNNIARPAFTQIVEYDLKEDQTGTIAFKGARIEILNASASTITYRVAKGFDL